MAKQAPAARTVELQHPNGPGTTVFVTEERAARLEARGYTRTGATAEAPPPRVATTTRQRSAPKPARKPTTKKA